MGGGERNKYSIIFAGSDVSRSVARNQATSERAREILPDLRLLFGAKRVIIAVGLLCFFIYVQYKKKIFPNTFVASQRFAHTELQRRNREGGRQGVERQTLVLPACTRVQSGRKTRSAPHSNSGVNFAPQRGGRDRYRTMSPMYVNTV